MKYLVDIDAVFLIIHQLVHEVFFLSPSNIFCFRRQGFAPDAFLMVASFIFVTQMILYFYLDEGDVGSCNSVAFQGCLLYESFNFSQV